jgi:hypothetical protein
LSFRFFLTESKRSTSSLQLSINPRGLGSRGQL